MVIRVRNKDKPSFDDQWRRSLGLKKEVRLWWTRDSSRVNWEEFVRSQVPANETYSNAKRQFSVRNRDVLMNAQSPHSGGPLLGLLCSAVVRHCHRFLVEEVDWCASRLVRLICSQIILTVSSPARESVELPHTCHPSPRLITFAFRSSEASLDRLEPLWEHRPIGYGSPLS